MGYSITFKIRNSKKPTSSLYLRIRNDKTGDDFLKVTAIKVDPKNFNAKKQSLNIKDPNYKWFYDVKNKFPKEIKKLHEGSYTPESAMNNLLNLDKVKSAGDFLWDNYVAKTQNSQSTINNRRFYVNWVENNTPYSPLTKRHLSDVEVVKKIAKAIKDNPKNSINGADTYFAKLDDVCNWAFGNVGRHSRNKFRPFADNNLRLTRTRTDVKQTETFDFKKGIQTIKTGQQFESALAWLLSYCLCIDGIDLSVINKDRIQHFAPYDNKDAEFANKNIIEKQNDFNDKGAYVFDRHLRMRRGKQKQNLNTVQFNIYPIPKIFWLLKLMIKKFRPNSAYEGKDPFRLFNFNTENESDKPKWKKVNDRYTRNLKPFGAEMSSTRPTFASNIVDLDVPSEIAQAFLKHSFRATTLEKHYLKHPQEKRNIIQKAGMDAIDVIGIWYSLLAVGVQNEWIKDGFISDLDKEFIKKGKVLTEDTWLDEWNSYKKLNAEFQEMATQEITNRNKEILGF